MSDNNKDLVMVDFSDRDQRSFKAYLRGGGDGRNQLYEKIFESKSGASLKAMHKQFGVEVWARAQARMQAMNQPVAVKNPSGSMLARLSGPVVGLLLGVMLYQVFFS